MRRRYVWCPKTRSLIEVSVQRQERIAPAVFGDLPGYESPVTGKWVDGKKARREDLKRTGSRPYEGRKVEEQIAASFRETLAREADKKLERDVVDVWQHSPERIRKLFK